MSGVEPMRRRSVRRGLVALGAAVAILVTGCTAQGGQPSSTPSATPSPTETAVPESPSADPVIAWAEAKLATMTLEQKVASTLMLHVAGTDAARIRSFVDTYQPGGLIFMGDNVGADIGEVAALVAAVTPDRRVPLLIGMDQEGGDVERISSDRWPSAQSLKFEPPETTEAAFSARSTLLDQAGVSVNFGVIADETDDPGSFIYRRVLGTTPDAAAERVAAAVRGENGKVLTTLKHFPGHGAAPGDSHVSVPSTTMSYDDWAATAAKPFEAGIDAGAPIVMFGHLNYSSVDPEPATLSPTWHQILHDDLGFDGITITDDIGMLVNTGLAEYQNPSENVIRALAAGNTMVLYILGSVDAGKLIADVSAAVTQGRITQEQLDSAALKLLIERRHQGAQGMPLVSR